MQNIHLGVLFKILWLRFEKVQNIAVKRNNFIIL